MATQYDKAVFDQYGNTKTRLKQGLINLGHAAAQASGNAEEARNRYLALLRQDPSGVLSRYVEGALPEFNRALHGIRENAIARGLSTGGLGTSYEGDLASAFQRNIAGQAANLYGTQLSGLANLYGTDTSNAAGLQNSYLNFLAGQNAQDFQREQSKTGFGDVLGGLVGLGAGAFLGPFAGGLGAGLAKKVLG